jgi:CDP-diacylglycerol--serine O-phosphatidyltransferase
MQRPNLRRGVYIIPTLLTMLNIFFGFRAIISSTRAVAAITEGRTDLAVGLFETACLSLFIAAIFDTFDGLIARALGATSEFGKEYDSIADVVTFGAAPAVLVYCWGLRDLRIGAPIAFIFLVSVSLRLARFNVMAAKTDHRYFVGLPSPAGALTLASIIYYAPVPVSTDRFASVMVIVTVAVAFAMVSPIRWRSQKGLYFKRERSPLLYLIIALILGILAKWPREFLFVGAICYLASGPLVRLWSIAFRTRTLPPEPPPSEAELTPATET